MSAFLPAQESLASFLLISLALGGAGAYATGRALALTWRSFGYAVFYLVLLTIAVRFLHFALFQEPIWDLNSGVWDYGVGLAIAAFAYYRARARQMARQYGFLASTAAGGES